MDSAFDATVFRNRMGALQHRERFAFPVAAIPRHFRESAVLIAFWEVGDDVCSAISQGRKDVSPRRV
ncbi:MAG: hypothetical protein AAGA91_13735 [Pseudomonadota bacterium]